MEGRDNAVVAGCKLQLGWPGHQLAKQGTILRYLIFRRLNKVSGTATRKSVERVERASSPLLAASQAGPA